MDTEQLRQYVDLSTVTADGGGAGIDQIVDSVEQGDGVLEGLARLCSSTAPFLSSRGQRLYDPPRLCQLLVRAIELRESLYGNVNGGNRTRTATAATAASGNRPTTLAEDEAALCSARSAVGAGGAENTAAGATIEGAEIAVTALAVRVGERRLLQAVKECFESFAALDGDSDDEEEEEEEEEGDTSGGGEAKRQRTAH